jgi:hypothetical protein
MDENKISFSIRRAIFDVYNNLGPDYWNPPMSLLWIMN